MADAPAAAAAAAGGEQEEGSAAGCWAELPHDFLEQLLLTSTLQLPDLLNAASCCAAWNSVLPRLWRPLCLRRWHHWAEPLPADDAAACARVYAARHQRDCELLASLGDDLFPTRQHVVLPALFESPSEESLDVLAAAAHSADASSLLLGTAHRARLGLLYARGGLVSARLQQLLAAEPGEQGGGAAASGSSEPPAAAAEDPLLEVACLVAQAVQPLADVDGVRRIIRECGEELRRRMQAASAAPGSRQALALLNQLLFGPPPAAAATSTPPTAATAALTLDSEPAAARSPSGRWWPGWQRWWQNGPLDGADLSTVVVPRDGRSGLGLEGAKIYYYNLSNSLIDEVLARRHSLPITLAVLHRAVGAAAGLDVHVLNSPRHVINLVELPPSQQQQQQQQQQPEGGAGGSGGESVLVDVFDGGRELDRVAFLASITDVAAAAGVPAADVEGLARMALSRMSPGDLARRMARNIFTAAEQEPDAVPGPDGGALWGATARELAAAPALLLLRALRMAPAGAWRRALLIHTAAQHAAMEGPTAPPDRTSAREHPPEMPQFLGAVVQVRLPVGRAAPALVVGWRHRRPDEPWPVRLSLMLADPPSTVFTTDTVPPRLSGPPLHPGCGPQSAAAAVQAWRSEAWREAHARAHRLLRTGWWEPGFAAEAAALDGHVAAGHGDGDVASSAPEQPWAVLARRPSAGKWFEGLYRAPDGAVYLVPNAWLREMYPQG